MKKKSHILHSETRVTAKPASKKATKIADKCTPGIVYNDLSISHPVLEQYFGYLFRRCALIYRARIDKRFSQFKLEGPHFGILSLIANAPTISQIQFCNGTGIDKASMVKIMDQLEKLKLIERKESSKDRRIKNLTLTAHGKKVFEKMNQERKDFEKDFLSVLTADEVRSFQEMIAKLVKYNVNLI